MEDNLEGTMMRVWGMTLPWGHSGEERLLKINLRAL
jgi:hypothetical protein